MFKLYKSFFTALFFVSISFLIGCGSGGGNIFESGETSSSKPSYYNSENNSVANLINSNEVYSTYNGKKTLEINIPVVSGRVLYECLITNPNNTDITSLTITPPMGYANYRASIATETETSNSLGIVGLPNLSFREDPIAKDRLRKELYDMYLANEASNKSLSLRASVDHRNEQEGDTNIDVFVLSNRRKCTLAKVSNYAKLFIDQDKDGSILAPSISNNSLEQFANEFDNYIYPVLRDNFGNGNDIFWRDVDNDGKLSIVFSPIVNNFKKNVAGVFDTASINSSNPRDMVSIAVKSNDDKEYSNWFMDARETIAHEMQHIVNYSAKKNYNSTSDILWIDEGLAVCAEILYRKKRSEAGLKSYSLYYGNECPDFPGNDARFYYASYYMPELSIQDFTYGDDTNKALAHYGQKGLFFYYIYEQYGKETLRQICQGDKGTGKFSSLISDRSLEQLSIDFNFASLNEKIRHIDFTNYNINPYDVASGKHKFITDMQLIFTRNKNGVFYKIDQYYISFYSLDSLSKFKLLENYTLPANGGTLRLFIEQPSNYKSFLSGASSYSLFFDSSAPVVVNMVRASQN